MSHRERVNIPLQNVSLFSKDFGSLLGGVKRARCAQRMSWAATIFMFLHLPS
jgi:hypothetical protein